MRQETLLAVSILVGALGFAACASDDTTSTGGTGGSGNVGNTGNTGGTGNTGNVGNTGGTGNTGNTGNTGGTGNTGNVGGTGGSGNTGGGGGSPGDCGNGVIDGSEVCDGLAFGTETCTTQGVPSTFGYLTCSADCLTILDSFCLPLNATCGNDTVESTFEQCDGTPAYTCADIGFDSGDVACNSNCTFDLSGCVGDICTANDMYGNDACDPCTLIGGAFDDDCTAGCGADSNCASYLSWVTSTSTCLYYTGTEDPDCGTCGDDTADPTEWCDGTDVPVTCADLGYVGGTIACDANCRLDASACVATLTCAPVDLGTWSGTAITRTDDTCATGTSTYDNASACTGFASAGDEIVYQLVIPANATLRVTVQDATEDASLYVLSDCADPQSCLAGADNTYDGEAEELVIPPDAAQRTVYIVADTYGAGACDTATSLTIDLQQPESDCQDYTDNDGDGYLDCADATNCKGVSAQCTPGATAHGLACTVNTNCVATGGDPLCLDETVLGWPGGYCTEFCSVAGNDCGADAVCYDVFAGMPADVGVCMKTCTGDADCRTAEGWACLDMGAPTTTCWYQ